jgi:antitoxin component YwqK of YwqJK toxin-antitoxin module
MYKNLYNKIKRFIFSDYVYYEYSGNKIILEKHFQNNVINLAIEYYHDGSIKSESHYMNGLLHKENTPAYTEYYMSGNIKKIRYCYHGNTHKVREPAIISYREDGSIELIQYYNLGKWHRPNGPAYIAYYETGEIYHEMYYIHGEEHLNKIHNNKSFEYEQLCDNETIESILGHL